MKVKQKNVDINVSLLLRAAESGNQNLSTGGRCPKDVLREVKFCPFMRLWLALVLGPAGPTRGERAAERGRGVDNCGDDDKKTLVGNEDEGVVEEEGGGGGGGEEEGLCTCVCRNDTRPALGSGGIDGRRRLLDVLFESASDMPGVPVCDRERGCELERELEFELSFALVGDGERASDRERTSKFVFKRGVDGFGRLGIGIGDLEGGSNPGGRMDACIPRLAGLTQFRDFWSMSV